MTNINEITDINELRDRLREDVSFDLLRLDQGFLEQSSLFLEWSEAHALAKNQLAISIAFLDTDIRQYPERYNLDKTPEKAVERAMEGNEGYLEIKSLVDLLAAGVKALEHRKLCLQKTADLWTGQYFAGPQNPNKTASYRQVTEMRAETVVENMMRASAHKQDEKQEVVKEGITPKTKRRVVRRNV